MAKEKEEKESSKDEVSNETESKHQSIGVRFEETGPVEKLKEILKDVQETSKKLVNTSSQYVLVDQRQTINFMGGVYTKDNLHPKLINLMIAKGLGKYFKKG